MRADKNAWVLSYPEVGKGLWYRPVPVLPPSSPALGIFVAVIAGMELVSLFQHFTIWLFWAVVCTLSLAQDLVRPRVSKVQEEAISPASTH
jgi:hypothetical protein